MAFGLGNFKIALSYLRRRGFSGTPISMVQPVEGDTFDDVTTYGTFSNATFQSRSMEIDGVLSAYLGSTAMTAGQEVRAREVWQKGSSEKTFWTDLFTVIGEPPPTTYPVLRGRVDEPSSATSSTTHTTSNPVGSTVGDLVTLVIGFAGNPGTVTVASGTDWVVSAVAGGANKYAVTAWKILTGSGDTLILTSTSARQSAFVGWADSAYTGTPIFSTWNEATITTAPNSPSVSFGGTKACRVMSASVYSQSDSIQTGAPTGYSQLRSQLSASNGSSSVRVICSEIEVTGTAEDPPAYPGPNVVSPLSITIAIEG